jgi:hypothetical protein
VEVEAARRVDHHPADDLPERAPAGEDVLCAPAPEERLAERGGVGSLQPVSGVFRGQRRAPGADALALRAELLEAGPRLLEPLVIVLHQSREAADL